MKEGKKPYGLLVSIILLVVFGPIYLIPILNIKFFATTKIFDVPIGGFLLWIYHLVVAAVALIVTAIINVREKT